MGVFSNILKASVEILVLACLFYMILRVLRGSRGMRMLVTIVVMLIVLQFSAHFFELQTLGWLCGQIFFYLPFFLVVVFQAEIRRVLLMMNVSKLRDMKTHEANDGETDQKLTLIQDSDSTYQLKFVGYNAVKRAQGKKLVKIPSEFKMEIQK